MLLKKRVARAFELMRERRLQRKAQEEQDALPTEKGDKLAMVLAGLITVLPIALLALLVMVGIPLLLTWL